MYLLYFTLQFLTFCADLIKYKFNYKIENNRKLLENK